MKVIEQEIADVMAKATEEALQNALVEMKEHQTPDQASNVVVIATGLAQKGHADAQYALSLLYFEGLGVSKNAALALEWLRKAADQGHPLAQTDLGMVYYEGQVVEKNLTQAVHYFGLAAGQGLSEAEYTLGHIYLEGDDATVIDKPKAVELLRRAAEKGHVLAQIDLGALYLKGEGVEADPSQALEWYGRAAEQDAPEAQFQLAKLYLGGALVTNEVAKGTEWLTKAAIQGHEGAILVLRERREEQIRVEMAKQPDSISIILKSGETTKGELVGETETEFRLRVANQDRTIFSQHNIAKSEVKSVLRETSEQKRERIAYQALLKFRLNPNEAYPVTYYNAVIATFEQFKKSYPDSSYSSAVGALCAEWKKELQFAMEGKIKFAGRWLTAQEADRLVEYKKQWMMPEQARFAYSRDSTIRKQNERRARDLSASTPQSGDGKYVTMGYYGSLKRPTDNYRTSYYPSYGSYASYGGSGYYGGNQSGYRSSSSYNSNAAQSTPRQPPQFNLLGCYGDYEQAAQAKSSCFRQSQTAGSQPHLWIRLDENDGRWCVYQANKR